MLFHQRPLTRAQFRRFMLAQSKPYPEMIKLVAKLKVQPGLKIALVRNAESGLNVYRIRKVKPDGVVDSFISSCCVNVCQPNAEIFRLALDIDTVSVQKAVHSENTPMFVEVPQSLCIQGIHH